MKKTILLTLVSLLIASACDSPGAKTKEKPKAPAEAPGDVSAPAKEEKTIWFHLSTDPLTIIPAVRKWPVVDDTIVIDADMTGDGLPDHAEVKIEYDTSSDVPVYLNRDGAQAVAWPFDPIKEVLVGDVDKDGDADIFLDEDMKYYLVNTTDVDRRKDMDEEAFKTVLKKVEEKRAAGDVKGVFLEAISAALGTAHSWTVPGEGPTAPYDRDTEYDFNIGNCVTWVEQILAMVRSGGDFDGFVKELHKIRYLDGVVDYAMRNHFQEADWIPNNIAADYIADIVTAIAGEDAPSVSAKINKKNWYAAKTSLDGDFSDLTEEEYAQRLLEFQSLGVFMPEAEVTLRYVPFFQMITGAGLDAAIAPAFVDAMPDVAIFNLANDGVKIADDDGAWITDLIVTHVGFVIKDGDSLKVYHSTPNTDTGLSIMTEEDFLSFLNRRFLDNPKTTAVGLHISSAVIPGQ
jgi:hypothetical protein